MMMTNEELKKMVKEKYAQIADQSKTENEQSCCGIDSCCTVDYAVFAEDYSQIEGYVNEADLGLGCGLPTEFAKIKEGDTVLDLGSGAGNDCFIAREIVGEKGKVIGIDMTERMIEKARSNAEKRGFNNVEFRLGDIEQMPLSSNIADVIVSNCVLNLVPDKVRAFQEIYRVLKVGGHFSISDVVLQGELPAGLQNDAEMYAGCVSGAIQSEAYLQLIKDAGFKEVVVQKSRKITLPDEILVKYMSPESIKDFKNSGTGIFSITVFGKKEDCCVPGSGCC